MHKRISISAADFRMNSKVRPLQARDNFVKLVFPETGADCGQALILDNPAMKVDDMPLVREL